MNLKCICIYCMYRCVRERRVVFVLLWPVGHVHLRTVRRLGWATWKEDWHRWGTV
ncbi:hypothetical protein HanXRQr2_Chr14g0665601 [Helianthus annuus]|uniref:Uncharacterized protein n=1 Tax=Helianthus annuus TaxID=4232 RepID=A0A9K3EDP7_HELAN|nr:hypothetical protein HanXRQr2_Chr14g0665601 [Helianthus annuus]KAJ0842178.1 hypothetical protein HanPSC8_Chr14g0638721 [Helianthus annuus]